MSPQPPEVVAGEQTMFQGSGSVKIEIRGNTSRSGRQASRQPPPSTGGCNGNLGARCSPGLWKDKFSLAKGRVSRCRHGRLLFLFPPREGGGRKESKKEREIKSTRVKLAQRAKFKTRDKTLESSSAGSPRGLFPGSPGLLEPSVPTRENSILCFIKHFI